METPNISRRGLLGMFAAGIGAAIVAPGIIMPIKPNLAFAGGGLTLEPALWFSGDWVVDRATGKVIGVYSGWKKKHNLLIATEASRFHPHLGLLDFADVSMATVRHAVASDFGT